jgi:hypothetical protein
VAPAEPLLIAIERKTFDIFAVAFETVTSWTETAELLLAFELAPPPKEHGPVRVNPAFKRLAASLFKNLIKSRREFGVPLFQFPLKCHYVHNREVTLFLYSYPNLYFNSSTRAPLLTMP